MKKLTVERANELKEQGITHIASIVKTHFNSKYFKYEKIETVLNNDGKMPEYTKYNGFIHGTNGNHIDWNHTARWSQI